jgi:hypothetical protein
LNAKQRFLAKRIFDALMQAMIAYEDAKHFLYGNTVG